MPFTSNFVEWNIEIEELSKEGLTSTQVIAIEIDPRIPCVRIGPRNRTGGRSELWNRALIRIHRDSWSFIETNIEQWFLSTEARALLQEIYSGYRAEMTWSGDTIGHWSETAIQSVDSILQVLDTKSYQ